MKKYETWEVFRELSTSTNPKLKFKNIVSNNTLEIRSGKFIAWNSGSNITLDNFSKWEVVQESVSFMEAVKAFKEGKTIESVCGFNSDRYSPNKTSFMEISPEEILEGKWYIEGCKDNV